MLRISLHELAAVRSSLDGWLWIMDTSVGEDVLSRESDRTRHVLARERIRALEANIAVANEAVAGLVPGGLLDPHQVVAVAAASDPIVEGLCVFDEQGLGKTLVGIAGYHAMRQRGLAARALIFAPKNMVGEWKRDIERFLPGRYRISIVTGSPRQRRIAIKADADVFIANFEAAISDEAALRGLVRLRAGGCVLIVDESFHVKNPGARRTAAIKRLRDGARRCLVLCGTPAPNSPHDIVEQFNIADGGITFQNVAIPEERDLAKDVIGSIIERAGVYLRRLKADVLTELPGKTFNEILVPLAPAQQALYESTLRSYTRDLRLCSDREFEQRRLSILGQRSALLRICTDPAGVVPGFAELPAKRAALDRLLADLVDARGEKVVLWTSYRRAVDDLMSRYARHNPVRIDGTVADVAERRRAIARFQEDEATRLFVGNPAAAGAGITLHRSRIAIYESLPIQAAAYFQSIDRIHRRGQTRPVQYYVLLGAGTLEVSEYRRLSDKAQRARALLGDREPTDVTRQALLEEALAALAAVGETVG